MPSRIPTNANGVIPLGTAQRDKVVNPGYIPPAQGNNGSQPSPAQIEQSSAQIYAYQGDLYVDSDGDQTIDLNVDRITHAQAVIVGNDPLDVHPGRSMYQEQDDGLYTTIDIDRDPNTDNSGVNALQLSVPQVAGEQTWGDTMYMLDMTNFANNPQAVCAVAHAVLAQQMDPAAPLGEALAANNFNNYVATTANNMGKWPDGATDVYAALANTPSAQLAFATMGMDGKLTPQMVQTLKAAVNSQSIVAGSNGACTVGSNLVPQLVMIANNPSMMAGSGAGGDPNINVALVAFAQSNPTAFVQLTMQLANCQSGSTVNWNGAELSVQPWSGTSPYGNTLPQALIAPSLMFNSEGDYTHQYGSNGQVMTGIFTPQKATLDSDEYSGIPGILHMEYHGAMDILAGQWQRSGNGTSDFTAASQSLPVIVQLKNGGTQLWTGYDATTKAVTYLDPTSGQTTTIDANSFQSNVANYNHKKV